MSQKANRGSSCHSPLGFKAVRTIDWTAIKTPWEVTPRGETQVGFMLPSCPSPVSNKA
jgi:hypothetical protein